jgi:hypothetical protein
METDHFYWTVLIIKKMYVKMHLAIRKTNMGLIAQTHICYIIFL